MADRLLDVLEEARARGFLGPGPVEAHVHHARALADLAGPAPESFLDLGSGAGIPGLVLAGEWPGARGILAESQSRRGAFLDGAVETLGLGERVTVAVGRAEELARRPELRSAVELVVSRSFGPPAVTAECAVGFLRPGGRLMVAEPPEASGERWSTQGLGVLGLTRPEIRRTADATAAVLTLAEEVDDLWPRRPGIPAKRRLW